MTSPLEEKLCTAAQAVARITDGATVICGGFVGAGHPEALTAELERRFLSTGMPQQLTLVYAAGQGDGRTRGLNHLAHPGLLKRVIGGHWGLAPQLGRMALAGDIEAYNFPQGVICHLLREIAGGRPGCLTHVGLGTFIDPQNSGGKLNSRTTEDLVERVRLKNRDWLFYHAFPVHVGLIRATAADPFGNLLMDDEAVIGDVLPIAQAARRGNGDTRGLVIAQVHRILDRPAQPQHVRVPGRLVDCVVVANEDDHWQTFGEPFNARYCQPRPAYGDEFPGCIPEVPETTRRIIASRACDELQPGTIANLGIGLPEGIAAQAAERGLLERITLTLESGPIGGLPASGLSFGASAYPEAIIDQPSQFDFYDGGGLDFAALGAAQVDAAGNVNVSRFGSRFAGVGGFVNISQNAKRVVFCGTFTTDGLKVELQNDRLRIVNEGRVAKFVRQVEQISFSGQMAAESNREILYVTERAVFRLTSQGLELTEVAAGIDIQRDIIDRMDFVPEIREPGIMRIPRG